MRAIDWNDDANWGRPGQNVTHAANGSWVASQPHEDDGGAS